MTTGTTLLTPSPVETTGDRIRHVKLSTLTLPLDTAISDAKEGADRSTEADD